jgi:hypothetical protein
MIAEMYDLIDQDTPNSSSSGREILTRLAPGPPTSVNSIFYMFLAKSALKSRVDILGYTDRQVASQVALYQHPTGIYRIRVVNSDLANHQ